jgi:MSHA pilin protein MshD
MCARNRRAGFTLVELVLAIAIVGVAVAAAMGAIVTIARHSADPMARQQAQLIAEAYLEEILLKRFYDPNTGTVCPAPEGTRGEYNNVCDYRNISAQAPASQTGAAISELAAYRVTVTVSPNSNPGNQAIVINLGSLSNDYGAGLIRVLRVDVEVTGPGDTVVRLTGYRTNYSCNTTIGPDQCRPLS